MEPDRSDFALPVPAEEFAKTMQTLLQPDHVIAARYGGHMADPQEVRFAFARIETAAHIAAISPLAPARVFIESFDGTDGWMEWILDRVDPLRLAASRGQAATGKLTWVQLLYFLHSVDMYRRCYYRSMLDQAPVDEFEFSETEYLEDLQNSVLSADWRWLVPCLMSMVPRAVPDSVLGLKNQFDCLKEYGVITGSKSGLMKFTDHGQNLGLEFMLQWVSALGLEICRGDGKQAEESRLFVLGTNKGAHLFEFEKNEISYTVAGGQGVKECLNRLLNRLGPLPKAAAVKQSTPPPLESVPDRQFCSQCGKPLALKGRFCPACGAAA
ncbi:MAG: zinc ribbon domain-containing protein [Kiritimatiellaeota bacterium]|nr:zinc ribbon domain-containing protein [Kiritimatiellota bacterium]